MKSHPDDIDFGDDFTALDSLSELSTPASRVASSASTAAPSSQRDKQLQMLAMQMATAVQKVKKPEVTPENKILAIVDQFKGAIAAAKQDCNSGSIPQKKGKLEERVLPQHVTWTYFQTLFAFLQANGQCTYSMSQTLRTSSYIISLHPEHSCGLRFSTL